MLGIGLPRSNRNAGLLPPNSVPLSIKPHPPTVHPTLYLPHASRMLGMTILLVVERFLPTTAVGSGKICTSNRICIPTGAKRSGGTCCFSNFHANPQTDRAVHPPTD